VNASSVLVTITLSVLKSDVRALLDVAKKHLGEFRQPIPIEKLVESVRFHQLFEL